MSRTASSHRTQRPASARSIVSGVSEDSVATTVEIIESATSTLQGLRTADALQIWRALGCYVQDQLAERRPVRIDQFGVFGLNESAEPVFLADATFLQTNRLRERERRGQVLSTKFGPVARLNPQAIGTQYLPKCRKEIVATVIANVVALVGKWAKQGRRPGIRLGFLPVGEWQCDSDGIIDFHFLAEFRKHLRLGTITANAQELVKQTNRCANKALGSFADELEAKSTSSSKVRLVGSVKTAKSHSSKSTECRKQLENQLLVVKQPTSAIGSRPKTAHSNKSYSPAPTSVREHQQSDAKPRTSALKHPLITKSSSVSSSKERVAGPVTNAWTESRYVPNPELLSTL